ncbi:hypothetical protein ACH61_02048 [Rathayibacter tanaceti]|uniref:Uncharacterized protein n=1 Tax=Rathayibacter tanaceti TaxID=1671680 RepID=A0A166HM50_9MICO|nr:hypothetical protein ACH61_02048 [Rathayibacter tanaceti]
MATSKRTVPQKIAPTRLKSFIAPAAWRTRKTAAKTIQLPTSSIQGAPLGS